jgi:hypothetical protein
MLLLLCRYGYAPRRGIATDNNNDDGERMHGLLARHTLVVGVVVDLSRPVHGWLKWWFVRPPLKFSSVGSRHDVWAAWRRSTVFHDERQSKNNNNNKRAE